MVVDINIINEYVEKGLVEKNSHPTLPIAIYNYSREVQYEGKWDNITKMCRALVLDDNGNGNLENPSVEGTVANVL